VEVMPKEKVTVFRPYAFRIGQKIHIEGGPRGGDWEVIGLSERKVWLRCPVSGREVGWDLFCYLLEENEALEWPQHD
jgi:hypothetical protein